MNPAVILASLYSAPLPRAALDPTPEEANSWLRNELARPEYQDRDVLTRLIDWFLRQFDSGVNAASASPILTTLAAIVTFVVLIVVASLLAARARRTARSSKDAGVLGIDSGLSAAGYRHRAEVAMAAGDFGTAVVDGFRALALQQVEIGRIEDHPQATAREVGAMLSAAYPDRSPQVVSAARLFDEVLYGHHDATQAQARDLLEIDAALRAQR